MQKLNVFNLNIKKLILLLFVISSIFSISCDSSRIKKNVVKFNLSSDWWKYRHLNAEKWKRTPIPHNLVYSLQNDTLVKKIYFGKSVQKNKWIEDSLWEFQTVFYLNNSSAKKEKINLIFEGLDTHAEVYLNDSILFYADNMFKKWKIDCKDRLDVGKNMIYIKFYPPKIKQKEIQEKNSYILPYEGQTAIRKAMFHFGTDFGFRYVESGIWKKVYIEAWNNAKIENVEYITKKLLDSTAYISAIFEIEATKEQKAEVAVIVNDSIFHNTKVDLQIGKNKYEVNFEIKNYKLWWTHDLGEPHLYKFTSRLLVANREEKSSINYGIRTIELNKTDNGFDLSLNGKKIWIRGATYAPLDMFYSKVHKNKYQRITSSLILANINVVRVWEGGIYEKDVFYNLCDKKGLLIWHDFMLPYKIYPSDNEFISNIEEETKQAIIKLRNHPSIAFWYGSNQITNYWNENKLSNIYSKQDSIEINEVNNKIFEKLLKKLVLNYDLKREYYTNFDENKIFTNFETVSYTNIQAITKFTTKAERVVGSEMLQYHQKPFISEKHTNIELEKRFGKPKTLENYIRLSQIAQAENFIPKIENKVKNRENIFLGIVNDYSLVISPFPIDHLGNWKASWFYVKNIFNNLQFFISEKKNQVLVSVSSNVDKKIKAEVFLKVYNFNGRILWKKKYPVTIEPNLYKTYIYLDIPHIIKKHGRENIVLKAEIIENKNKLTQTHYCFAPTKKLALKKPKIEMNFFKIDEGHAIELTTNKFAKNIYLRTGKAGLFDENYFDLVPGETKVVKFYHEKIIDKIETQIHATSFYDWK